MAATDTVFAGSIPEIYDRLLVPLLFDVYARELADRVAKNNPRHILETAAGTGALTRAMASRLPAEARIMATDLNQPMLDRAAGTTPGDSRIAWRQVDALALPFPEESFDVVACQFGVMFFPDKAEGYRQVHRVLKPGGTYIFSVWDNISQNVFANVVTQALATMFPDNPPTFLARTPHGYHDVDAIGRELATAGFASTEVETIDHMSRAARPHDAAIAYCQGTPLRNEIEARNATRLDEATRIATEALAREFGAGPIEGRIRAHVISAIR